MYFIKINLYSNIRKKNRSKYKYMLTNFLRIPFLKYSIFSWDSIFNNLFLILIRSSNNLMKENLRKKCFKNKINKIKQY